MFLTKANELKEKTIGIRRALHQIPEVGLNLPKTKAYVKAKLEGLGLKVKELGESGLSTIIEGNGDGKTLLLRADMDALPMCENSHLPFSAQGAEAHTCGHDLHTAMLLTAAEILIEHKNEFPGKVKLMFQPAEEIFKGSKMMIKEGILENPKVDAALAMHTNLDESPGSFGYNLGYMTTSCDNFKIDITGKGAHGAYPHTGIDPINAAVNIYQNFAELLSRENPPQATTTLTFGELSAGSSSNIIPETARMQGTMRTYDPDVREKMKKRMGEILEGIAKTTGCKIEIDYFSGVPSLYSNPELTREIVEIVTEKCPEIKMLPNAKIMASEDMADISVKVPTTYLMMNCKVDGINVSHHNPGVLFNEDAMPYGVDVFTTVAIEWLKRHK
ncbi:M20 metallopeptidase family protein [Treponema phagedenis]|uniref:Amidohydrolase n=1 Tax=Treponema phagedenis TaxID=162 RepID=A0AAE6ITY8_TREPH|nr:M20 family metallopeptidase [Treponema phagedenis]QEJ95130.1 amidohydrolase [Treponema phagedenis]QEJ98199.1 amidohydrolase [Treponema phagedenis]QEK03706.1 amidohydrolase [Treponema phagedenis]QEK06062.1 amidohydrolase [Treponema phagedenis]QEK09322.1 amidohydrolase [Treponema phagedenis]